jgi:hypothetical protein
MKLSRLLRDLEEWEATFAKGCTFAEYGIAMALVAHDAINPIEDP